MKWGTHVERLTLGEISVFTLFDPVGWCENNKHTQNILSPYYV